MSDQHDSPSSGAPYDQSSMELLEGAVEATRPQQSRIGRFLRGSLYIVLVLSACVLLAITAVPDLANFSETHTNSKIESFRSIKTSVGTGQVAVDPNHIRNSFRRSHKHSELKAEIKDLGGRWNSTSDQVKFTGTQIQDADLECVKRVPRVKVLSVSRTQISDAGLIHILGLNRLQELNISNTLISDAGLKQLQELPRLRYLHLDGTQITDAAIETLKNMPNLESLDISDTQITEEGLRQIQEIRNLSNLYVSKGQFTDAGIEDLKATLPECRIMFK